MSRYTDRSSARGALLFLSLLAALFSTGGQNGRADSIQAQPLLSAEPVAGEKERKPLLNSFFGEKRGAKKSESPEMAVEPISAKPVEVSAATESADLPAVKVTKKGEPVEDSIKVGYETSSPAEKKSVLGWWFKKGEAEADKIEEKEIFEPAPDVDNSEIFEAQTIALTKSESELAVDARIEKLYNEIEGRICQFTDPELNINQFAGDGVPIDFNETWGQDILRSYWGGQPRISRSLDSVYSAAMSHSYRVKDLTYIPQITETNIGAAEGEFDPEIFSELRREHIDEPTGSTLTTGTTGRLIEDNWTGEVGARKKFINGGEAELSHDFLSRKNNSTFLDPNPQTQTDVRLRVVQPLLRGNGIEYNTISIKVANLDTRIATEQMVNALEDYLLEVNRSYWGVYLARAAYAQRLELVGVTGDVVNLLKEREEIDAEATASEIVRAKASLLERKADLIRSKTAIRTAEERLRSLLNDPSMPMGMAAEFIPSSKPILSPPCDDVQTVAHLAIKNRAEIVGSENAIRVAGLRRDAARHDLLPRLNVTGEIGYAGLDRGRDFRGAYDDTNEYGAGWAFGFTFSQPWERRFAKSFEVRRDLEYDQAVNQLRLAGNEIILDVLVSYREVVTAYQDMQAKYQAVRASREEVRKLEELVKTDAGEDSGRTIGSRLQILLDAIERNQTAEESYLVSVVAYNYSLAALERAKGTFIRLDNYK